MRLSDTCFTSGALLLRRQPLGCSGSCNGRRRHCAMELATGNARSRHCASIYRLGVRASRNSVADAPTKARTASSRRATREGARRTFEDLLPRTMPNPPNIRRARGKGRRRPADSCTCTHKHQPHREGLLRCPRQVCVFAPQSEKLHQQQTPHPTSDRLNMHVHDGAVCRHACVTRKQCKRWALSLPRQLQEGWTARPQHPHCLSLRI